MAEDDVAGSAGLIARWRALHDELQAAGVGLLAVSKYAEEQAVEALVHAGQQDFAESRAQQLRDRALRYPSARWHMIGPLQKNKAKYVARHAAMWHSVEDIATARAVAELVENRRLPVLVQVNVAGISHQHGALPEAVPALVHELAGLPQLQFSGLMCMAPRYGDTQAAFAVLRNLRDTLAGGSLEQNGKLHLCMGMSEDFRIAIAGGADMVRIGSGLFDGP